jgi:cholera toxin transcriptional activator
VYATETHFPEPQTLPQSPNRDRIFSFGLYELDGETGDLRKAGRNCPRLQGQPLEVLLHLLDRRGEVVTREELRPRLWPADTFVDYDHSLNAAVNKLREALNDSADNPRFIQTVPRKGYRFIASMESAIEVPATEIQAGIPESTSRSTLLSDAAELPAASHSLVRLLFSLIQLMYLCFYIASLAGVHRIQPLLSQELRHPEWVFILLLVTALVGIPIRLYLLSASLFGYEGLKGRFLKLFPGLFPLDELWALAPFLLVNRIGGGLALAATAALLYVPFAQRSLLLMGKGR